MKLVYTFVGASLFSIFGIFVASFSEIANPNITICLLILGMFVIGLVAYCFYADMDRKLLSLKLDLVSHDISVLTQECKLQEELLAKIIESKGE